MGAHVDVADRVLLRRARNQIVKFMDLTTDEEWLAARRV